MAAPAGSNDERVARIPGPLLYICQDAQRRCVALALRMTNKIDRLLKDCGIGFFDFVLAHLGVEQVEDLVPEIKLFCNDPYACNVKIFCTSSEVFFDGGRQTSHLHPLKSIAAR